MRTITAKQAWERIKQIGQAKLDARRKLPTSQWSFPAENAEIDRLLEIVFPKPVQP